MLVSFKKAFGAKLSSPVEAAGMGDATIDFIAFFVEHHIGEVVVLIYN